MTKSKTKYTISEAARITGKSRTTIAKHIKDGKLSVGERDSNGNRYLDASELMRVYKEECHFERAAPPGQSSEQPSPDSEKKEEHDLNKDAQTVQRLLTTERQEREREREQLQARIDFLEDAVKQAQEGFNRTTLLLESRSGGVGDLEEGFRKLEQRIANQERETRQKTLEIERQANRYKKAYQAEKRKTVWQKLFG